MASHAALRWSGAALMLLALAACGSGGSPAAHGGGTVQVTTWYDPATKRHPQEQGDVVAGADGQPTATRTGLWTSWHPPEQGGGRHFEKSFVDGTWDTRRYWREWNPDSSLRFDWKDR